MCLCLTGAGGVAKGQRELGVCVLRWLGLSKQGRKYGRTFPPLSYKWACSPSGVWDCILCSPCWKVGRLLPSPGVPVLLPHCLWLFLTSGLSVLGCYAGVSRILLAGTFFLASIHGGHPGSLVTGQMSRICVFTAQRQKMQVWKNADSVCFR